MCDRIERARQGFEEVLERAGFDAQDEVEAVLRELVGLADRAEQLESLIEQGRRHIRWLMDRSMAGDQIQGPATGDGLAAAFNEGFENLRDELEAHRVWVEHMVFSAPKISQGDASVDHRLMQGLFEMVDALVRQETKVARLHRRVRNHSW
ncbi:MAG: hypothetical protein R3236_07365 [Phycisphaeraceae bacterium]|nr:hypothetical protein [Phycisphaeraceae bacterium]